jgi:hypothetical protein
MTISRLIPSHRQALRIVISRMHQSKVKFGLLWAGAPMRHFLQYWRTYNPEKEYDTPLNFAASGQFERVQAGDILWSVALKEHRLTLLGRLVVGDVVGRKDAVKRLGKNIYGAALYALSKPRTERDIIEAAGRVLKQRSQAAQERLEGLKSP